MSNTTILPTLHVSSYEYQAVIFLIVENSILDQEHPVIFLKFFFSLYAIKIHISEF